VSRVISLYELSGSDEIRAQAEAIIAEAGLAEPYARILAIFREVQDRHTERMRRLMDEAIARWASLGDTGATGGPVRVEYRDPGDEHRDPR
jgi:hypothetical protein